MDAPQHKAIVGANLRRAIEAIGITPAQAARVAGVSPSRLGNWMRGANYPDPLALLRLRARFGVTLDYIYAGDLAGLPRALADRVAGRP